MNGPATSLWELIFTFTHPTENTAMKKMPIKINVSSFD